MMEPSPYLSFWQVAEKWSKELKRPVMDVVMDMKRAATYPIPTPPNFVPPLLVWAIRLFSPQGQLNEHTAQRAMWTSTPNPHYYFTDSYVAGCHFLNSGECPAEVTTEIQKHLSQFGIRRDDFEKWCSESGQPMPKFWSFRAQTSPLVAVANTPSKRDDALKKILADVVNELIAENDRRPTCNEVFNQIKRLAKGGKHTVIQEVKKDVIYWKRGNGKEETTTKTALQKRLIKI